MGSRYRRWCFTLFAEDGEDAPRPFQSDDFPPFVVFAVHQMEISPETGRAHLQGYVECNRAVNMSTMKGFLGDSCHLEVFFGAKFEFFF